jgi:transposase InsO family protein
MKDEVSPGTGKRYPMTLVLFVASYSSASWYGKRRTTEHPKQRGPKTRLSNEELLVAILADLASTKFLGEGYQKVHARLRRKGIRASKDRVLRLFRENNLLAPVRVTPNGSTRVHDGTIITALPNVMWGTDGVQFRTQEEGKCWMFSVIDHCNDEILGWHLTKKGDRFAALEPVRQAVKKEYGCVKKHVVKNTGLFLRSDHGSQYDSGTFQNELKFLGLVHSPAFVRSPECNGIIERFHRTLREQVLDIVIFENLDHARRVIGQFIDDYNREWILHRLGFLSPTEYKNKIKAA